MVKASAVVALISLLALRAVNSEHVTEERGGLEERKLLLAPYNLTYHGGPLMSNGVNFYVIYYGTWNLSTTGVIEDFFKSLGENSTATLEPNLKQWWSVLSEYNDSSGNYVTSNVSLQQTYYDLELSLGTSLSINNTVEANFIIAHAINNSFPLDENGIYVLMTSADLNVSVKS